MRAIATAFVLLMGASLACASDARIDYGPVKSEAGSKAAAKPRAKSAPKRTAKPAAKPAKAASPKAEAAKSKAAQSKAAKAEAAKDKAAKDKAAKPDTNKRTPAKDNARKSDPVTTGAVAAAAKPAGLAEFYAGLSVAERVALQSDLSWAGTYAGPLDGADSERLADAVKAYQKRNKSKITGQLTPAERDALAEAMRPRQEETGWSLVEDPVTGARVGIPARLATGWTRAPSGTRWSSEQGQLQIETFRIDTGATLDGLFEQHQKETARRRVRFSAMRDDHFVVSGVLGLKKFHTRVYARNGDVRGLSILYDQAMEGTIDPMIVAMASAFQPFASYTLAGVTGEVRRKVEYGTALAVSGDGYFAAARATVARCDVIVVAGIGNAELLREDRDGGLSLLRVHGARKIAAVALTDAAMPEPGAEIRIVGIADPQGQDGGGAVTTVTARLGGGTQARALEPAPAQGFAGAAATDAQGRLLGLVVSRPAVVAGPPRPTQPAVVPVERVTRLLAAEGVAAATSHADAVKDAVRRVICVRK